MINTPPSRRPNLETETPETAAPVGLAPRRARLLAAFAAFAAVLSCFGLAPQAQASTPNTEWITACFYNASTGTPWSQQTSEQYWTASGWKTVQTLAGTSNGCRAWKVPAGTYARYFVAYQLRAGFTIYNFSGGYTSYLYSYGSAYKGYVGDYPVTEQILG